MSYTLSNPDRIYHGVTGMLVSHGEEATVRYLADLIGLIDTKIMQTVLKELEIEAQAEEGSR